jgi:hypothetical protein
MRNPEGIWINTTHFSEAASYFQRYGRYTDLTPNSQEWIDFWEQELDRCKNGYSVGGAHITGHHYFYLNYSPIKRKDKSGKKAVTKKIDFPDFYDGDYDFFHLVDIARWGCTDDELKALQLSVTPKSLEGGKHMIVAKARRKGFSYKNAAMVANTYNSQRNSLSIVGAWDESFLFPDGTMAMIHRYLSHLNEHTAWAKKRLVDRQLELKSGYTITENGVKRERGYLSSIVGSTFYNDPDSVRGKDGTLMLFEEAGAFKNGVLKKAYNSTLPAFTEGGQSSGIIIVFGTGSQMDAGAEDFSDMFYNPDPYNFLPVENIWDEGAEGTTCGHFFPVYQNLSGFIDEHGNSLADAAKEFEEAERRKKAAQANGAAALGAHVIEFPFNPSEAFTVKNLNDFPVEQLTAQLNRLRTNPKLAHAGQSVTLIRDDGQIKALPDWDNKLRPIIDYPVRSDDLTGAVVIYEHPVKNSPKGLYKMGYDPYVQDMSQGPSLGAMYVYKSTAHLGNRDMIVAEYIGRPSSPDDCHRIAEMLAEYYGAQIMIENMVKDAISYFTRRKKEHLMCEQPDAVLSGVIKNSKVSRKFGVHMNAQIKDAMAKYIKTWLLMEREVDENGRVFTNIDYIYSKGLLEELIKYNPKRGNFDRVIAFGMIMIQLQEESDGKVYGEVDERSTFSEFASLIKQKYAKV